MIQIAEYLSAIRRSEYEALRVAFGLPDYVALWFGGHIVARIDETLEHLEQIMRELPKPGKGEDQG